MSDPTPPPDIYRDPNHEFWARHLDLLKYLSPGHVSGSLLTSLQYKYLYCPTPKVASSTIKSALFRMELDTVKRGAPLWGELHNPEFYPLLTPLQVRDLNRIFSDSEFTKFCFVRNPYGRILSCYMNKIWSPSAERTLALQALGRGDEPDDESTFVTLEAFLTYISGQSVDEMNPHWCPQWHLTFQHLIDYDFVGRHESFERDLSAIGTRLHPDFARYISEDYRNSTGPSRYHLLTPAAVELIQQIYAADFEAFDYALDPLRDA